MADFKNGRFNSKKQDWITPNNIYFLLDQEFKFDIDLAADENNSKCGVFFDEKKDAMSQSWAGIGWLNPPYGNYGKHSLQKWVKKSYDESRRLDCVVVMLIPSRTNTKWWHNYAMESSEIRFLNKRLSFGGSSNKAPFPSAIIVFSGRSSPVISSFLCP